MHCISIYLLIYLFLKQKWTHNFNPVNIRFYSCKDFVGERFKSDLTCLDVPLVYKAYVNTKSTVLSLKWKTDLPSIIISFPAKAFTMTQKKKFINGGLKPQIVPATEKSAATKAKEDEVLSLLTEGEAEDTICGLGSCKPSWLQVRRVGWWMIKKFIE